MKTKFSMLLPVVIALSACSGSDNNTAIVNAAPTISAIANQRTMANQKSAAIVFTVADEDAASLTLSASSDNQQVIPDAGIELGGANRSRMLAVTPEIDTLGDAFITVFVADRFGLMASTSFLLTVDPQQSSMQQFVRTTFVLDENGDPAPVNAVAFDQDASDDDFADLFTP